MTRNVNSKMTGLDKQASIKEMVLSPSLKAMKL